MYGLTDSEYKRLHTLNTPSKVQDYLDSIPFNYEKKGDTLMSPASVLKARKANCIEGAILACAAFLIQGREPLLLDLIPSQDDDGHVVALFREGNYWGAVSKTNHAVLRFRDPIYTTHRELALSYFHEYFLNSTGKKTLRAYGGPYNLEKLGLEWIASRESLFYINKALDSIPRTELVPKGLQIKLRNAIPIERKAGRITQWKKSDPRT